MPDHNSSGTGIRRTAIVLAVIAVAIYLLFIAAGVFGFKDAG